MDIASGLIAAFAGALLFAVILGIGFGLLFYILNSIGFMTLAKHRGIAYPWLIWIPVVGAYTMGAVADDIEEKRGGFSKYRYLMLGGSLLSFFLSGIGNLYTIWNVISEPYGTYGASGGWTGTLGGLIMLAYYVIHVIVLHRIFRGYRPRNATLWTVLCAIPLTAFLQSIFPFVLRNDSPAPDASRQ